MLKESWCITQILMALATNFNNLLWVINLTIGRDSNQTGQGATGIRRLGQLHEVRLAKFGSHPGQRIGVRAMSRVKVCGYWMNKFWIISGMSFCKQSPPTSTAFNYVVSYKCWNLTTCSLSMPPSCWLTWLCFPTSTHGKSIVLVDMSKQLRGNNTCMLSEQQEVEELSADARSFDWENM